MRDLSANSMMNQSTANLKAIRIAYRVLYVIILLCLCVLAVLIGCLMRGVCFIREWLVVTTAGVLLMALAGLLIPLVRSKVKKPRKKLWLTVAAALVVMMFLSLTVSFTQVLSHYGHSPIAYFDSPDGKYSIVLMQSMTMNEDGSEYPVLSAYPCVSKLFFLMTESDTAYVQGLKTVNWKAEWVTDRRITFTITDLTEGEHLSFSVDLAEYITEEE